MSREYYDDDFRNFEDIYSDSSMRDSRRRTSQNRSRSTSNRSAYRERGNYDRSGVYDSYTIRESRYRDDDYGYSYDDARERRRPSSDQRSRPPKKRMKRTARRALIVAVGLLIVFAFIMGIVAIAGGFSGLGDVGKLTVSEVSDSSMVLSWKKASNAKGYRVYYRENGAQEDTELQTINDPNTLSLAVTDLGQATEYVFTVAAFNDKGESKKKISSDTAFTLPQTVTVSDLSSVKKGSIHVEWQNNPKCDGYVVEYHKPADKDFKSYQVDDRDTNFADISDLDVKETYGVRVYAFVNRDNEKFNGLPSEEKTVEVTENDIDQPPKAQTPVLDSEIDPNKPMIAFSFDDGPSDSDSSDRILDTLEKNGVKATFFMVGWFVEKNADNVKRKAELKMELGNHTWDHTHYSDSVTPDDISRCSDKIKEVTGQYPTAFRSPGGMTTDSILGECAKENMPVYRWSVDTKDWESRDASAIYNEVMSNVGDGDIVLMHEIYDATADALEKMIPELKAKGYQIVTCHDLIRIKTGKEPEAGVEYFSANQ